MSDNALVSIIIPAYNVEQYISRGIESCLNQTYSNIEIVIVDDGSTDGTWKVIEDYQKKDARIIAEHKSNGGVSSARNKALKIAKGDFLLFLDSDDWLEKNAVSTLMELAKSNKYCLICSECYYVYIEPSGELRYEQQGVDRVSEYLDKEEALLRIGRGDALKLQSSCYKLFNRQIISQNKLCFKEGIHHGEDGLFTFEYLKRTSGIMYTPEPLWDILERPGSATTSSYNSKWLTAITAVQKMMEYEDNSIALQNQLRYFLVERTFSVALECIRSGQATKENMHLCKTVLRNNMWKVNHKQISMKRFMQYALIAYFPKKVLEVMLSAK